MEDGASFEYTYKACTDTHSEQLEDRSSIMTLSFSRPKGDRTEVTHC